MSTSITTMKGNKNKSIKELVTILKETITQSAEQVSIMQRNGEGQKVSLLVYEKYYFRNGNYANLTILLTENETEQTADIIGSGGGDGIFNLDWGANSNFSQKAVQILKDNGFTII